MKRITSLFIRIDGKTKYVTLGEKVERNQVLKTAEVYDAIEYHKMRMLEAANLFRIMNAKQSLN